MNGNTSGLFKNNSDPVTRVNVKYNSSEDIQKYSRNRLNYGYDQLYRSTGNHALFETDLESTHSVKSYSPFEVDEIMKCDEEIKHINEKRTNNARNYTCYRYQDSKLPNANIRLTSNEKIFHDKTTYCRPVVNYNEQFIYKTMERNARLKRLVRKLAIARQKEKEIVSWNNFINDLKNKHGLDCNEPSLTVNEPDNTPEIINDYYNTKFSCVKSRPCRHLLQEFYGTNDEIRPNDICHLPNESARQYDKQYFPHERNPYCYPTSSQGRLIMMDRNRRFKQSLSHWPNYFSEKNLYLKSAVGKKYLDEISNNEIQKRNSIRYGNISHNRATSFDKSTSVETDAKVYPDFTFNKYQNKATFKLNEHVEDKNGTFDNVESTQANNRESDYLRKISLINIDAKLETLIDSINIFIDEIKTNKSKRKINKDECLKCKDIAKQHTRKKDKNINFTDNNFLRKESGTKLLNRITSDASEDTFNLNQNQWSSKLNDVLQEKNIYNSKSLQICNTLRKQPCSVQITFEVPTRDCSTEVTKSLSKQNSYSENKEAIIEEGNSSSVKKEGCIEEIATPENIVPVHRMTIAVNTDPLSLLGLLKISTDTFKYFLSYMPNFDYYSYLSLLQFPLTSRKIEPHYVCNICGADFNKPSQLSDHIRDHNLGKTKECCVCRHVLDTARKSSGLFRCRYCGQLFARAYCCELHQESCARRLGRRHDVTSSLMLLR